MPTASTHTPERRAGLERVLHALERARFVALTTHVNADGDGAGCETALGAWLIARGKRVIIVNPTPFPQNLAFLLPANLPVVDAKTDFDRVLLEGVDLLVVLDTGEPRRIDKVPRLLPGVETVVIDHHPVVTPAIPATVSVQDTSACATGELIYDMIMMTDAGEWPRETVQGLYTAVATDTGSFRYANTTPRTHEIAAELIRRGLDPEDAYRRLYGTVPLRRIQLLTAALENLEVDAELPITWITVPRATMQELEANADDLDGIIEHARSIAGTEVAILFRETNGSTKVSLRSNGELDVNALARQFGGGGHVKAAGALMGGAVTDVRPKVLDATRAAVRELLANETTKQGSTA